MAKKWYIFSALFALFCVSGYTQQLHNDYSDNQLNKLDKIIHNTHTVLEQLLAEASSIEQQVDNIATRSFQENRANLGQNKPPVYCSLCKKSMNNIVTLATHTLSEHRVYPSELYNTKK